MVPAMTDQNALKQAEQKVEILLAKPGGATVEAFEPDAEA